jgi:hypothetical protein
MLPLKLMVGDIGIPTSSINQSALFWSVWITLKREKHQPSWSFYEICHLSHNTPLEADVVYTVVLECSQLWLYCSDLVLSPVDLCILIAFLWGTKTRILSDRLLVLMPPLSDNTWFASNSYFGLGGRLCPRSLDGRAGCAQDLERAHSVLHAELHLHPQFNNLVW